LIVALDAQWSAVARGYRLALIVAVVLGVGAVGAAFAFGTPIAGGFVCVGLGLGAYNSRRLWTETSKLRGDEENPRKYMVVTSARRLGLVTLIAFLVAIAWRDVGWTVFLGIVVFQLLMMALLARPLKQVVTGAARAMVTS
jgi:hypothetical protein